MSKSNTDTPGVRFAATLIYGASRLVAALPHWFLYYPVADLIYFVLYRVARYRLAVVRDNLATSFPEKSTAELRSIERGFYRNLSEYFIDAIDLSGLDAKGRLRRCPWPDDNRAEVARQLKGRNWVALMAHFGSWELFSSFGLYRDASAMVSAHRPLKNRAFDLYYERMRNFSPRVLSVPSNDILRYLVAHRDGVDGSPLSVVLVADQNPPLDAQSRWVPFLNHPTVFFHGGEKIARKFAIPVYYMKIRKRGRGLWEQSFEMIWDGVSPTADYEITGRYADLLEQDIRRTPELWLWSHRRWKRQPEGPAAREYSAKYESNK
jgi:KDO2-lipid IV(A) lauroyltransferase